MLILALKDRLNDAMSCDSLTFGGNALQSLLARNVKDRCINSRLKEGKSRLVLSPRKLYGTSLKLKKKYSGALKLFSDYVHQKGLICNFMVFNALVSNHFLNAHAHFIITCPPSVFKRPSDINHNFLKRKILH